VLQARIDPVFLRPAPAFVSVFVFVPVGFMSVEHCVEFGAGAQCQCNSARRAALERFSMGFYGPFGFGERRFSVTLFIPKDACSRVLGHFVAPVARGASEGFHSELILE
jgi:hypothetical protein